MQCCIIHWNYSTMWFKKIKDQPHIFFLNFFQTKFQNYYLTDIIMLLKLIQRFYCLCPLTHRPTTANQNNPTKAKKAYSPMCRPIYKLQFNWWWLFYFFIFKFEVLTFKLKPINLNLRHAASFMGKHFLI